MVNGPVSFSGLVSGLNTQSIINAEMAVYFRERQVPAEWTVEQAGITPMQYVFVDYVDE